MTDCVHFIGEMCQELSRRIRLCILEQGLFRVFDFKRTGFKWIAGNPESALKEPFSVVLTKTMAGNILAIQTQLARRYGTAGGTLLSLIASIQSGDITKTIVLATVGAVVSFVVSLGLKWIAKKWSRSR